jgi:hypothetical protein
LAIRYFIAMMHILPVIVGMSLVFGQQPDRETKNPVPHAAHRSKVKEPALAEELNRRCQSDQDARKELVQFLAAHQLFGTMEIDKLDPKIAAGYKAAVKKVKDEDRKNLLWMKKVVTRHGWPGKSLVGAAGAQNAWLLVQHADADRDFQELCLKKIKALPRGEVEPRNMAYLTDRILVGRGNKQRYGTQAVIKDGKAVPSPIEEEDKVDERRKAVGLEPLTEYLKTMEAFYTKPLPTKIKEKEKGH